MAYPTDLAHQLAGIDVARLSDDERQALIKASRKFYNRRMKLGSAQNILESAGGTINPIAWSLFADWRACSMAILADIYIARLSRIH